MWAGGWNKTDDAVRIKQRERKRTMEVRIDRSREREREGEIDRMSEREGEGERERLRRKIKSLRSSYTRKLGVNRSTLGCKFQVVGHHHLHLHRLCVYMCVCVFK